MQDHQSLDKLRECFNQSLFSTEISSRSLLHQEQPLPRPIVKISSKFTEEPQLYLKKIKLKKKEASRQCLQALRDTVKAQMHVNRMEREAAISRYDFMKLYTNKKFKLLEQNIKTNHQTDQEFNMRLSLDRVKKLRVLDRISLSSRKEQTDRNVEQLQEASKQDKNFFRETLRWSRERSKQRAQQSAQKIRKQHTSFTVRKRNLLELTATKSKFNYLSRMNEQMQAIKDYQQMIDLLDSPLFATHTSRFH